MVSRGRRGKPGEHGTHGGRGPRGLQGESAGGGDSTPLAAIFDSSAEVGHALYVVSDGHVDLAQADDITTAGVVGVCFSAASADQAGQYVTEGQVVRSNWTLIVGSTLLTPGSVYFLDASTPGCLTDTPVSGEGNCVTVVGRAVDETTLDIEVGPPIMLSAEPE